MQNNISEETMAKHFENFNTLAKLVMVHLEKSLASERGVCLMCADPDNFGASLVAMFLIMKGKFSVSTAEEILQERRVQTNMIR
jgi:hypothetical protein